MSLPIHVVCQQTISFRVVMVDGGVPALARWCEHCRVLLEEEVCDPIALRFDEIPGEFIAQLLDVVSLDHRHRGVQ